MRKQIGDLARLHHILDALSEIEKYTQYKTFDTFAEDTMLQAACLRQLEIIGEASIHISNDLRAGSAHIEWREIIGLRNILIHDYFGVDLKIVWDIIQNDIPKLKIGIHSILDSNTDQSTKP